MSPKNCKVEIISQKVTATTGLFHEIFLEKLFRCKITLLGLLCASVFPIILKHRGTENIERNGVSREIS
jgi:hypothetical protein